MQHTTHMGYGYTQIWSLIGFDHGQMYIGSETHSYGLFIQGKQTVLIMGSFERGILLPMVDYVPLTNPDEKARWGILHGVPGLPEYNYWYSAILR